jgi:hypothetical protein
MLRSVFDLALQSGMPDLKTLDVPFALPQLKVLTLAMKRLYP